MVNTLLMVNITPICKRLFREQIYAVYSFLSYAKKKIQTWFVSLASREYFGIKPTTFLSTFWQKNYLLVMWNVRCSYKNSCWAGVQFQCPCANDLQLQRCSQKYCFEFWEFGFEGLLLVYVAYPWIFATIDSVFVS